MSKYTNKAQSEIASALSQLTTLYENTANPSDIQSKALDNLSDDLSKAFRNLEKGNGY